MAAEGGKKMQARLVEYAEKFDALQPRERLLLAVMSLVVIVVLANAVLIEPALQQQQNLQREIKTQNDNLLLATAQLEALRVAQQQDPNQSLRARLQQLQQQDKQLQSEIAELQRGVVQPAQMPKLLETILKQQSGLELMALKTLPVEPVGDTPAAASATKTAQAAIYRHAVVIEVRGSYFDLQRYLQALEASPWQFFWQRLEVQTEDYPQVRMKLLVQTFSFDHAWLSFGKTS